jgi:hypothetical protein
MQIPRGLDDILDKIADNVKDNFEKIKGKIKEFPKYLDERIKEIGNKTYVKLKKYWPIIGGAALAALPLYVRTSFMAGLYATRVYKGLVGRIVGYTLAGVGITFFVLFTLSGIHGLIPPNNGHIQYIGSTGYEGFVPKSVINYDGHTDPIGDLILNNGTTIHNTIWDGQYSGMIVYNHNEITQLNGVWVSGNSWARPVDQLNGQQYLPLQDVYVIKGPIPIQQVTINGQTYYVIQANIINLANIAGFYTYQGWIPNFVVAMNMPGTTAALLPQLSGNTTVFLPENSPLFYWPNATGTVAFQTKLYQYESDFIGGYVLVLPNNKTIIPYGITSSPSGWAFFKFTNPQQVYNASS